MNACSFAASTLRRLALAAAVASLLLAPAGLEASSIDVKPEAAKTGNYGARVALAECAETLDVPVPSGNVTEDLCTQGSITANVADSEITGNVKFTAGGSIAFDSGFSTAPGASFAAIVHAGLTIGNAFLEDDTPGAEPRYAARYALNADNLLVSQGEEFAQFIAYSGCPSSPVEQFRIVVTHNDSLNEDRIYAEAADSGGPLSSSQLILPPGYNDIELEWKAAGNGGSLNLCVNDAVGGTNCTPTVNHDNAGQIDCVRWGVPEILNCSSCGSLDMDNFDSRRQGPIGP